MSEELDQLLDIIVNGVADIKRTYASANRPIPKLSELYAGPDDLERVIAPATGVVVAAALQLVATLRLPTESVLDMSFGALKTASLASVMQTHVPEVMREAGPQGIDAQTLGKKAKTSPNKIARILRFLASRHIFREVKPGVFAHNRLSSVLDSGKSVEEIRANPITKHNGSQSMSSVVEVVCIDHFKPTYLIPDMMADPVWCMSEDVKQAPSQRAFGVDGTFWDFLVLPGNEHRQARFSEAMGAASRQHPPDFVVAGFPWGTLPKGSLVVDVGGGVGEATRSIFRKFPDLRYVVQDIPQTVADGQVYWKREHPDALTSGQVRLVAHDFFKPQPIKDAAVFLLRNVVHDWAAPEASEILKQLASSAAPSTKLVLVEYLLPYATPGGASAPPPAVEIPGAARPPVPEPLLACAGMENSYGQDIEMMNVHLATERTLGDFIDLCKGSGWKLTEVIRIPDAPSAPVQLVAVLDA